MLTPQKVNADGDESGRRPKSFIHRRTNAEESYSSSRKVHQAVRSQLK
jgi:hypothetical protein